MGGCTSSKSGKGYAQLQPAVTPPVTPAARLAKPAGVSASFEPQPKTQQELAQEQNDEYKAIMMLLAKVPLLQRLPRDQHPILASACIVQDFKPNEVVVTQGDLGSEFFVIRGGAASVLVASKDSLAPREVAQLRIGDYFGERALLRVEPRSATIRAAGHLSTLKITRDKFQELSLHERLQFTNRKAVGGGGARKQLEVKPPSKKTPAERQLIIEALQRNETLQAVVALSEERMALMADVAWAEAVRADTHIITEGDPVADYFYIVKSGGFDVLLTDRRGPRPKSGDHVVASPTGSPTSSPTASPVRSGSSLNVGRVGPGGSFGELALMYSAPRAATVVASEESEVFVIDRKNFKEILMKASTKQTQEYVKYLQSVDVFKTLTHEERWYLAEAMIEMHFAKDDVVVRQGEPGSTFYVLCEGEVAVVKDGEEVARLSASDAESSAHYFGERALLNQELREATVVVRSDSAKVMALDKESFQLLLGPLQDVFKRRLGGGGGGGGQCTRCWPCLPLPRPVRQRKSEVLRRVAAEAVDKIMAKAQDVSPQRARAKVFRADLVKVGILGCGSFGVVELWEHRETKETYAMKCISKGFVVNNELQEAVLNERFILTMTNSPFITTLYETFNGAQTLYFLLEAALGGELHATYQRKDFYGSPPHGQYYSASVALAFQHLHERRIIYRDLKPENLLLTEHGRLKVADMGLAKFVIGKTYTTCGTPEYFAPEVIASVGHNHAVDWWMLGILIYELMSGEPPFKAENAMATYSKVLKGIEKVAFATHMRGAVGDLVKAMLRKEPSERLPVRPGGVTNLKEHEWFRKFPWDALQKQSMDPPYRPTVRSRSDVANFAPRLDDLPETAPYTDDGSGWDDGFASSY